MRPCSPAIGWRGMSSSIVEPLCRSKHYRRPSTKAVFQTWRLKAILNAITDAAKAQESMSRDIVSSLAATLSAARVEEASLGHTGSERNRFALACVPYQV